MGIPNRQIGIYKITSPSGKVYIGQSWDIKKRFSKYRSLQSVYKQRVLFNSFKKHYMHTSDMFSVSIELSSIKLNCLLFFINESCFSFAPA